MLRIPTFAQQKIAQNWVKCEGFSLIEELGATQNNSV